MRKTQTAMLCCVLLTYSSISRAVDSKIDGQSHSYESVNNVPVVVEMVNGQSTLGLFGSSPRATFGNVDGQSVVDAHALKADSFTVNRLNGQSVILLCGRTIELPDIDGQCTVIATIRYGGSLSVKNMNGQSRILWCKESASDPTPSVTHGNLNGQSKVVEVTPH